MSRAIDFISRVDSESNLIAVRKIFISDKYTMLFTKYKERQLETTSVNNNFLRKNYYAEDTLHIVMVNAIIKNDKGRKTMKIYYLTPSSLSFNVKIELIFLLNNFLKSKSNLYFILCQSSILFLLNE